MAIASRVKEYLDKLAIDYQLLAHTHTGSSMETAARAHVPGDHLAKAVVLSDGDDYLLVIVPADYHVHLGQLHKQLGREVGLATEAELAELFPDCETGAIPPLGEVYGLRTLVDRALRDQSEVFFESGDHENLVRVSGEQFRTLVGQAESITASRHI